MIKRPVHGSDRALVRYLERVGGFDLERLRQSIAGHGQKSAPADASALVMGGVRLVLRIRLALERRLVVDELAPGLERDRRQGTEVAFAAHNEVTDRRDGPLAWGASDRGAECVELRKRRDLRIPIVVHVRIILVTRSRSDCRSSTCSRSCGFESR